MTRRPWTNTERATLRALYPDHSAQECAQALGRSVPAIHMRANALGLRKSLEWISQRSREVALNPSHGARAHRFQPGITPWNKGQPFQSGGRSAETQFKPGRPAHEASNWLPIGSERINADGYLERKTTDDPSLVPARRWVAVHRLVWEATHGPIAPGMVVAFKPGMRTTSAAEITLDRLELMSRAEIMRRNSYHNYPKELAQLIQLRGALNRKINASIKDRP
jgi:hypothetical protein